MGIPSGSMWTSVLNIIINYVVIDSILIQLGYKKYKICVYGDDHMVIFNEKVKDDFKEKWFDISLKQYGLQGEPSDAVLAYGDKKKVGYRRPVYDNKENLEKGTSNLKPTHYEYLKKKKQLMTYDHKKGTSHRWEYHFAGRFNFLQYYWNEDGNLIRPAFKRLYEL